MRNLLSFHKKLKWQPGANTVAYYKFNGNLNDSSGNGYNGSMRYGSFTYSTLSSGEQYLYSNGANYSNNITIPYNPQSYTINVWCKYGSSKIFLDFQPNKSSSYWPRFQRLANNSLYLGKTPYISGNFTQWTNVVLVLTSSSSKFYINGQYVNSGGAMQTGYSTTNLSINTAGLADSPTSQSGTNYMDELIIENKARTAQEISDYYNLTKGNYGTSESQASSCFLAGTPVLIEGGSKPIDELNIGDVVLSYNKSTGEKEYNKVVDIIEHTETKDLLYTLDIEGQKIEATEFHKFYISDNKEDWRWEEMRNLKEGQFVFSILGAKKINSVESKKFDGPCYNITVDNNHNYFVYDGILVHNTMSTN